MLEKLHETDVHKWVLLSDPPFVQKSRIQVLKMTNWRTVWRTVERKPRRRLTSSPAWCTWKSSAPYFLDFGLFGQVAGNKCNVCVATRRKNGKRNKQPFKIEITNQSVSQSGSRGVVRASIRRKRTGETVSQQYGMVIKVRFLAVCKSTNWRQANWRQRFERLSANSPFLNPEFWISGQMQDQKVKPIYRHQFYA